MSSMQNPSPGDILQHLSVLLLVVEVACIAYFRQRDAKRGLRSNYEDFEQDPPFHGQWV